MQDNTPSDAELIEQHGLGQPNALAQLWLRYDSMVYGTAHSIVCRRDVAEDIRQEVFLKVYAGLTQLRDGNRFAAWLGSITHNACYSWLRRQKPTAPLESLSEAEHPRPRTPDEHAERSEQRTLLRQMIDQLPEDYRVVVELHYFQEQRVHEIAAFLGLPESTVKWRIHKAREDLRRTAKINGYLSNK